MKSFCCWITIHYNYKVPHQCKLSLISPFDNGLSWSLIKILIICLVKLDVGYAGCRTPFRRDLSKYSITRHERRITNPLMKRSKFWQLAYPIWFITRGNFRWLGVFLVLFVALWRAHGYREAACKLEQIEIVLYSHRTLPFITVGAIR